MDGARRPFRVPFVRKINWKGLMESCKKWAKNPMNMALFIWLIFVACGLVLQFLLMLGILNKAIPDSALRDRWAEVDNQVLNALFTIMCLYQHPQLFHHLVLLCRWRPNDFVELRAVYCKNMARRPHEREHMMLVVLLLHMTCFSQYVLCALYWGYSNKDRPDGAEMPCIVVGTVAPVIAGLYTVYSPLGKKIDESEEEALQRQASSRSNRSRSNRDPSVLRLGSKRVVVTRPEWAGGLFDVRDDMTVAYSSFFCLFCVFGWNMERLGFGNMYVHMVTFILFCVAPFWVFCVSALNITDSTTKYIVGITGVLLCFFGLLYGGFWRVQMRKKFKLPGNPICCGFPLVTDCMQWLFCWSCALAQEVRTANFYDVEEESFYKKDGDEEEAVSGRPALAPLPREGADQAVLINASSFISLHGEPIIQQSQQPKDQTSKDCDTDSILISVEPELPTSGQDHAMTPPLPPLIHSDLYKQ